MLMRVIAVIALIGMVVGFFMDSPLGGTLTFFASGYMLTRTIIKMVKE